MGILFDEIDLVGKVISKIEVSGYGIDLVTEDGFKLTFNASDGGYSSWEISKEIENLVNAAPVYYGHWITHNPDNPFEIYGECSECGFEQSLSEHLNYCPNCGAKMDEN